MATDQEYVGSFLNPSKLKRCVSAIQAWLTTTDGGRMLKAAYRCGLI
jgi:hypothetical protein